MASQRVKPLNSINLEKNLLKKNLIFDVGMHKGEDTDFYLKKGFNVIGFEADPELIVHCQNRFKNEIAKKKTNYCRRCHCR